MKKKLILLAMFVAVTVSLLSFKAVSAEALVQSTSAACQTNGSCQLSDVMRVVIWITRWILGIVGSAALLMFVYGGFMFLISAGNSSTVDKGKKIIIGAVIGLVLVFTSYTIINFSLESLGYKNPFGTGWQNVPEL